MSGVVGEIHQPTEEELYRAKNTISKTIKDSFDKRLISEGETVSLNTQNKTGTRLK